MKLARIFAAVALAATVSIAHAQITCPPIATVKSESSFNSVFIEAKPAYMFVSNVYNYDGRSWATIFGGLFDDTVQTSEEAISVGNKIFQDLTFAEPTMDMEEDDSALCVYVEPSEVSPYFVATGTPALDIPQISSYRLQKFIHKK